MFSSPLFFPNAQEVPIRRSQLSSQFLLRHHHHHHHHHQLLLLCFRFPVACDATKGPGTVPPPRVLPAASAHPCTHHHLPHAATAAHGAQHAPLRTFSYFFLLLFLSSSSSSSFYCSYMTASVGGMAKRWPSKVRPSSFSSAAAAIVQRDARAARNAAATKKEQRKKERKERKDLFMWHNVF